MIHYSISSERFPRALMLHRLTRRFQPQWLAITAGVARMDNTDIRNEDNRSGSMIDVNGAKITDMEESEYHELHAFRDNEIK